MIKANELRIGNKFDVEVPAYINHRFTALTVTQKGCDTSYADYGQHAPPLPADGIHGLMFIRYEEMEPIPLTSDILEKCGFEGTGKRDTTWTHEKMSPQIEFSKGHYQLFTDEGNFLSDINIEHLHQLQNLYFALTGEELNVRL